MINVLLVDDEQSALNSLKRILEQFKEVSICGEALTVEEAVELTCSVKPDLVFLDIILGEKTGFDYINSFLTDVDFKIVFTTAYNKFAIKAFEFNALDYLLKPIDSNQLEKALSKMTAILDKEIYISKLKNLISSLENNEHKYLFVKASEGIYRLKISELLFLEASRSYTAIYSKKDKEIISAKTLSFYNKQLKDLHFIRIHHKYLVNLEMIKNYNKRKKMITLINKKEVPVSVRKERQFLEVWCKKRV